MLGKSRNTAFLSTWVLFLKLLQLLHVEVRGDNLGSFLSARLRAWGHRCTSRHEQPFVRGCAFPPFNDRKRTLTTAEALPMPWAAPVIRITFPASRLDAIVLSRGNPVLQGRWEGVARRRYHSNTHVSLFFSRNTSNCWRPVRIRVSSVNAEASSHAR